MVTYSTSRDLLKISSNTPSEAVDSFRVAALTSAAQRKKIAVDAIRSAVAVAYAVPRDKEHRKHYDGGAGEIYKTNANINSNMDPNAVFEEVFKDFSSLREMFAEDVVHLRSMKIVAMDRIRSAVVAAYALIGSDEDRKYYDRTGGMGKAKATDWDLNVMFEQVFKDLSSLRKVLAEDTLRQLNAQMKLTSWSNSAYVLQVSDSGTSVVVTTQRKYMYPVTGLAFGVCGVRGLASSGQNQSGQIINSSMLVGLGCALGFFFSLRPVFHLDLSRRKLRTGSLSFWQSGKLAERMSVEDEEPISASCNVPILLKELVDKINEAEERKKRNALLAMLPCTAQLVQCCARKCSASRESTGSASSITEL